MATPLTSIRRATLAAIAILTFAVLAWRHHRMGMHTAPPPFSDPEIKAILGGPTQVDGSRVPDFHLTLMNDGTRALRVLNPECDVVPEESTHLYISRDGRPIKRMNSAGGGLFLCIPDSPRSMFESNTTVLAPGAHRDFPCRVIISEGSRSYQFSWNYGSHDAEPGQIEPGRYRLSVHYEVDDAVIAKAFCPGTDVTREYDHIWTGKTDSNTIDVTVR